jgi:hypothetical protein
MIKRLVRVWLTRYLKRKQSVFDPRKSIKEGSGASEKVVLCFKKEK